METVLLFQHWSYLHGGMSGCFEPLLDTVSYVQIKHTVRINEGGRESESERERERDVVRVLLPQDSRD